MYLSLNWLKDYVKLPSSMTPEELALKLTTHTVEIDSVEDNSEKFKNVVVGKILEIKKHPNADKLMLAQVDIGSKKLNIVCGASNIKKGQFVPVALVGAILPNGMEIKRTKVRGEISDGMMCAEDELGLGDDHSDIMVLEKKAKVGQDFSKYLGVEDVIIEVDNKSITHRPDLWGHYGIAREIAAFLNSKFREQKDVDISKILKTEKELKNLRVTVKDFELCPRYMAIQIDNIEIKESPKWMQDRLIAVGSRPINNIVDITNYVMLELGQPLHAFDASKVDEIVVRRAKKNEKIKTLDGQDRKLDDSMLVIADSKKPIAIAGVMGGENSEVSDKTASIILESANFDPIVTRKTAQKLNLRTDAASRFEKSLDPNLCEKALARTLELIKESCPKAMIASNLVDEQDFKLDQGPIQLDLDWLNKRIGVKIDAKEVVEILESLGFEIKVMGDKNDIVLEVKIPTWRATKDVSIPEDLVEEVARIYGYNKIEEIMPEIEVAAPEINENKFLERRIREILSMGVGLSEVYNYSFLGEKQLTKLNINYETHVRLANPISSNHTLLRQSLVPNLVENVKTNQAKFDEIKIFEIGSVYFDFSGDINKDSTGKEKLPYQEKRLGILIAGGNAKEVYSKAKGVVEYLADSFDLEAEYEVVENDPAWAEKGVTANILVSGKVVGSVSILDKKVSQKTGVKKEVVIAEISLKELFSIILNKDTKKYVETSRYPAVVRDLAFVVDSKMMYNKIKQEIENFDKLISKVELFDVYEGERLGRNKKNLAFHITYQADRTMKGEEVDKMQKKLAKYLEEKLGARVRDF